MHVANQNTREYENWYPSDEPHINRKSLIRPSISAHDLIGPG